MPSTLTTLVEMHQSGVFRGKRRSVVVVVTVAVPGVAATGVTATPIANAFLRKL